MLRISS